MSVNSGSLEISSEGGSGELKNLYMGFRLAPLLFMSRSVVTVKDAVAGRDELLLVFGGARLPNHSFSYSSSFSSSRGAFRRGNGH